jgi:hypothetical protein
MNALIRPQLSRLASKAGLLLERWPQGTVRFTLRESAPPVDVEPGWFRDCVTSRMYLVGREKAPPLANVFRKRVRARFPLLTKHRVVSSDDGAEVAAVVTALGSAGWCVDNDIYVFPAEGGWLAYVGHHDELVVYAPRRAPLARHCTGPRPNALRDPSAVAGRGQ